MKKLFILPILCIGSISPLLTCCARHELPVYEIQTFQNENDVNWNSVAKADINIYKWINPHPTYNSYAQMVYINQQEFIIKLTCDEQVISSPTEEWSLDTYKESCLEAFIQFIPGEEYINCETNYHGCKCQEYGLKGGDSQYQRQALWTVSKEHTFLTNVNIQENYWQATVVMTLDNICYWYNQEQTGRLTKDVFQPGYTMRGNFYKAQGEGDKAHYGMWSEIMTDKPNNHKPNDFGYLKIK